MELNEIVRHKRMAYILTVFESLVLITLVGQLFDNPFTIFMSPLNTRFISVRNMMLVFSSQMYLGVKMVLRNRRISNAILFLSFFISQALFIHHFNHNRLLSIIGFNISIDVCIAYNLIFSFSSALFLVYLNGTLWVGPTYTRIKGLFKYIGGSIGVMSRNTVYIYLMSIIMTMTFLGVVLAFKTISSWIFFLLPFGIIYETSWKVFKDFLLMNTSSVIYFFLMNTMDQLLIYNSSLIDMRLNEWCSCDLQTSRLIFFQVSESSIRYPQMLGKISKSHNSISSIQRYLFDERNEILGILDLMKKERYDLESKMWLSIPQVISHSDKPQVLVSQRKIQFVKKIRSYNFIEIYSAKIMYFWRNRILINRYKNTLASILMIKNFMKYLSKYEDDYLLLKEVCSMFSATMKSLYDDINDCEKGIGMNLRSYVLNEDE